MRIVPKFIRKAFRGDKGWVLWVTLVVFVMWGLIQSVHDLYEGNPDYALVGFVLKVLNGVALVVAFSVLMAWGEEKKDGDGAEEDEEDADFYKRDSDLYD